MSHEIRQQSSIIDPHDDTKILWSVHLYDPLSPNPAQNHHVIYLIERSASDTHLSNSQVIYYIHKCIMIIKSRSHISRFTLPVKCIFVICCRNNCMIQSDLMQQTRRLLYSSETPLHEWHHHYIIPCPMLSNIQSLFCFTQTLCHQRSVPTTQKTIQ